MSPAGSRWPSGADIMHAGVIKTGEGRSPPTRRPPVYFWAVWTVSCSSRHPNNTPWCASCGRQPILVEPHAEAEPEATQQVSTLRGWEALLLVVAARYAFWAAVIEISGRNVYAHFIRVDGRLFLCTQKDRCDFIKMLIRRISLKANTSENLYPWQGYYSVITVLLVLLHSCVL